MNLKNEFLTQHNARDDIVSAIVEKATINEFPRKSYLVQCVSSPLNEIPQTQFRMTR